MPALARGPSERAHRERQREEPKQRGWCSMSAADASEARETHWCFAHPGTNAQAPTTRALRGAPVGVGARRASRTLAARKALGRRRVALHSARCHARVACERAPTTVLRCGGTWSQTTSRQWRGCGRGQMVDGEGELGGFGAQFPLDGALARCFAVRSARLLVACERRRRGNMVSDHQ